MSGTDYIPPARKRCDICGRDKITFRRVTRTTQVCSHSSDQFHRDERRRRRLARSVAIIEQHIGRDRP